MNTISRVLLTLESAATDRELIRAIPALIGRHSITITGLYICDEELLRAAELPFAKEVSLVGEVRQYSPNQLQQDFTTTTQRLRQTVAELAKDLGYPIQLDVAQGGRASELNRAAQQVDFVIVTRPAGSGAFRTFPFERWLSSYDQEKSLLIVNEPWASGSSVVVVCKDKATEESVAFAERYAKAEGLGLVIVLTDGYELSDPQTWQSAEIVEFSGGEQALAHLCAFHDARLLVLSASDSWHWERLVPELVDLVSCSILHLRNST